jgi:hypothetical protein
VSARSELTAKKGAFNRPLNIEELVLTLKSKKKLGGGGGRTLERLEMKKIK